MPTEASHIFLSHASADDQFVALLRKKLEDHGLEVWVDSRNLRGGSKLSPEIEQAIRSAMHFLVVISQNTINSDWVFDEIEIAEQVEKERPDYRAIPLMLPGITPKALKRYFNEEPAGEPIELEVGKLDEQLPHILAALGQRVPDHDLPKGTDVENKPIAELLLELSEPTLTHGENGKETLSARAELSFIPSDFSKEREVKSRTFRFTAPIGQIEQDKISWYLEQYLQWPVGLFRERAEKTESQLPEWGKALFDAALGQDFCREPLNAWQQSRSENERRFSVQVDAYTLETGEDTQANANEAASRLQSLPWELLHDDAYLSDGANPVRIRRRLPNFKHQPPSSSELPIRILLLSPRPEEKGVGYIDHRASALPLVQAVETLGDLVQLTVLSPPTLPALEKELHRAREANQPYHVLHFDGHGVYDRQFGLGALCFEDPKDATLLEGRRNQLVYAKAAQGAAKANQTSTKPQNNLASLLKDFRIPLVFLEACQTAQTDADPNASVAASLLEEGVTSVVAMSHNVLVETARRFVTEFYQGLAQGQRVGAAMLAGQKMLMRDSYRLPIPGAGDFHLQDWFVPILYQEQHDPQLFAWIPSETAQKMQAQQQQTRLGRLPEPPPHSFIGRSRDLLKAERLLEQQPYAVIRGQGGMGKTTLAVELADWLVKSRRFDRCAFVSVEEYTHDNAVTEVLLQQLVNANHNLAAEYAGDIDKALQAIIRTLENECTLIVVDNMESLLADETNRQAILDVLYKLSEAKLLFTTREPLPKPFHHKAREIELGALELSDAKALVMQVMNEEGLSLRTDDIGNTPQEVNDLVNSVGCHARALVLLSREVAQRGVTATTANVREIMRDLEQENPGQRENSLFASVELSLRRLSPEVREQIGGLAVFQDGGNIVGFENVLNKSQKDSEEIVQCIIDVGLAEDIGDYGYIRLDPALAYYLSSELSINQHKLYQERWLKHMDSLLEGLYRERFKDIRLQAQLTQLELPNLMRYLETSMLSWQVGELSIEDMIDKISSAGLLLAESNKPYALERVFEWQELLSNSIEGWSRASFRITRMQVDNLLLKGDPRVALNAAELLVLKCQEAGIDAYDGADYDLYLANTLLGEGLKNIGSASEALPILQSAQKNFEELGDTGAAMVSATLAVQGNCLLSLGKLDEAASAYHENIKRAEALEDTRQIATGNGQLAAIRIKQGLYDEALRIYEVLLELFEDLEEPDSIAGTWQQIGIVYKNTENFKKAEYAYRKSLSIRGAYHLKHGEAASLDGLGALYATLGNDTEALRFYQQAAETCKEIGDELHEGSVRLKSSYILTGFKAFDAAKLEILLCIDCLRKYGHEAKLWEAFAVLRNVELGLGNNDTALEAEQRAFREYLAYRKAGGENHHVVGRLALNVGKAIHLSETSDIERVIDQLCNREDWTGKESFLLKLKRIIAGERGLLITEDRNLSYDMMVELIILLESLQFDGPPSQI